MKRRTFLNATLTALATSAFTGPATAQTRSVPTKRIFVAGGGVMPGGSDKLLARYMLELTGKPDPIVCCLATAGGDSLEKLIIWYEAMNELPCRPRHLRLFGPTRGLKNFERQLLAADAIFVAGGNVLNMLAVWKAQGLDQILHTAWERGILLSGESAGMACWFEQVLSDSRPERLSAVDCLGWLKGSVCPHYHGETDRRPAYHQFIADGTLKPGLACDDGAGVLFEGDQSIRVVSISEQATAYRVFRQEGEVVEEPLKAELLKR